MSDQQSVGNHDLKSMFGKKEVAPNHLWGPFALLNRFLGETLPTTIPGMQLNVSVSASQHFRLLQEIPDHLPSYLSYLPQTKLLHG